MNTNEQEIDRLADQLILAISSATGIPEDDVGSAFNDGRLAITHYGHYPMSDTFVCEPMEVQIATVVEPKGI